MKTIKIIDLLIRCLEKDETLPKEIKFRDKYYFLSQHIDVYAYYRKTDNGRYNFMEDIDLISTLNKEIEIIGEEKEIEKIKSNGIEFYSDCINVWIKKEETVAYCEYLMNKVNELIDAINELKREK